MARSWIQSEMASDIPARGAYSSTCWMTGDDDDWLIEHVAAEPSHRGRGLVQALLDHALAAGKAAGLPARLHLVFYIGNDAAERCYAKAGFSFAEEKRDPDSRHLPARRAFAGLNGRSERSHMSRTRCGNLHAVRKPATIQRRVRGRLAAHRFAKGYALRYVRGTNPVQAGPLGRSENRVSHATGPMLAATISSAASAPSSKLPRLANW